jgi:peptide/nickel transport system substrate-binding protein
MFEPLLGADLKGNTQPAIAEAWDISSDGKVYTFRLRKGVKFHNGKEMTSEDVKFSMDYTMDTKNGAYGYSNLVMVERVDATDKYTLKVYLKKPSPAFFVLSDQHPILFSDSQGFVKGRRGKTGGFSTGDRPV